MRTKLRPISDDLVGVRRATGRFEVQLEIPQTSTLTEREIDKILAASSWSANPAAIADGYEGGRSILLRRDEPIRKGPVKLGGLQVSGIGYKRLELGNDHFGTSRDNGFHEPSSENFMAMVGGGDLMSTARARGRKVISDTPSYRALGTYTSTELAEKISKTNEISGVPLERLLVPHVEAYGRYLAPSLQGRDGPFGFIVFPVPDPSKERAINDFLRPFHAAVKGMGHEDALSFFHRDLSPYIGILVNGLRELHDEGRRVHLQTHMGNFYIIEGIPYLVDWGTMRRLGNNAYENIINRCLDIERPVDDYATLLRKIFASITEVQAGEGKLAAFEKVLSAYARIPLEEVGMAQFSRALIETFGRFPTYVEASVEWMKARGMEGYRNVVVRPAKAKAGRNEPCPCGSGKKYKHCHG